MAYAVKAPIDDVSAGRFAFPAWKTMYGGRHIAVDDEVFVFASGARGGPGLVALAVVTAADPVPRREDVDRQTPRVGLAVRRVAAPARPLGRRDLADFRDWSDGRPETELNFKLYRQATDKIVGLTDVAGMFLRGFF